MIPLFRERYFTFRFEEDRLIDRFHLEGVAEGTPVAVWKWQPQTPGVPGEALARGRTDPNGWVVLDPPLVVRAGEGFLAEPC